MEGTATPETRPKKQPDDWIPAKSFYSNKTGICESCLSKYEYRKQLSLPISKLNDKDFELDIGNFHKSLEKFQRPILFYHADLAIKGQALIIFTGNENFKDSYEVVKAYLPKTPIPATIISPYPLNKSNRKREHQLVQLTKKYFEPLGFIKLHLHSVSEFHEYGKEQEIGFLLLPLQDLSDYIKYAKEAKNIKEVIPAIFQP